MAFWESMTIAEMNLLLQRDRRNTEGWDKLIQLLQDNDSTVNMPPNDPILNNSPFAPAVYFFLCILKSQNADASFLQPCEIDDVCHDVDNVNLLPAFRRTAANHAHSSSNSLRWLWNGVVMRRQVEVNTLDLCIVPKNTTLNDLLVKIEEENAAAYERNVQSLMTGGILTLRHCLDEWDEVCKKLFHTLLCGENPAFHKICELVEGGAKQIILTGAPGTGKTRTAGLAARCMGTPLAEYVTDAEHPYPLVQFHPSYDYTDFVEGLRPVQAEDQKESTARFVKLDGSFKAFCRSVAHVNQVHTGDPKNDPDRRYFFLIDEINRADLSKVFGELMFCLEADKRGCSVQTQYRNLPAYIVDQKTRLASALPREDDVFADGFFIPKNAIILGTMNDIDRSVESMDFALYRRFEWREIKVNKDLLCKAFQSGGFDPLLKEHAAEAARRVMALNDVISGSGENEGGPFGLNRHYSISQGQFAHLPEGNHKFTNLDALMQFVWYRRIYFLLREYVRGEDGPQVEAFLSQCASALKVRTEEQETVQ